MNGRNIVIDVAEPRTLERRYVGARQEIRRARARDVSQRTAALDVAATLPGELAFQRIALKLQFVAEGVLIGGQSLEIRWVDLGRKHGLASEGEIATK